MEIEIVDPAIAYSTEPFGKLDVGQFFTASNPIKFDHHSIIGVKLRGDQYLHLATKTIMSLPDSQWVYRLRVVRLQLKPVFVTPPEDKQQ